MKAGKWMSLLLAVLLLLGSTPVCGAEAAEQPLVEDFEEGPKSEEKTYEPLLATTSVSSVLGFGECGETHYNEYGEEFRDEVFWTLDSTGLLTISGSGAISYFAYNEAPWYSLNESKGSLVTSLVIGEGITRVGMQAFSSCVNLETISFPNSLEVLDFSSFSECTSLKEIILPPHLRKICSQAFFGCTKLKSISIPDEVESIEENAFSQTHISSLYVPKSVKELADGICKECMRLTEIRVDPANPYYTAIDNVLFTKDKSRLLLYPAGNQNTLYKIPDSVEQVSAFSFASNPYLESVVIPGSVKNVGAFAFSDVEMLENVTIENPQTHFGENAFYGTWWLDSLFRVNQNFAAVNGSLLAFRAGSSSTVTVPYGITNINEAFSLNGIAANINFEGYVYPKKIILPETVTEIPQYAFYSLDSLSEIVMPESIKSVGYGAFEYCESLENIQFPVSIESVDNDAFWGTPWREKQGEFVTVNGILIEHCGDYYSDGSKVVVPEGIRRINPDVFSHANTVWIKEVVLPETLESIGDFAFYDQGMDHMVIPNSITEIGEYAIGYQGDYDYANQCPIGVKKIPGFTVIGKTGSIAQKYANENGLHFIPMEDISQFKPGDVTGDGKITSADALQIQRYVVKRSSVLDNAEKKVRDAADVTGEGDITSADALQIQRYVVQRPSVLDGK